MNSDKFTEISKAKYLYNIAPIDNLKSIIKYGILSKNKVKNLLPFTDISNIDVQNRRDNVILPNGKMLHDYANLYFNPRNAMLFYELNNKAALCMQDSLCILRIDTQVLNFQNVFISDRNAAVGGAKFMKADEINSLDFRKIYSESWNDEDPLKKMRLKALMMAEILVYNCIETCYIKEILVANERTLQKVRQLNLPIPVKIEKYLFFE